MIDTLHQFMHIFTFDVVELLIYRIAELNIDSYIASLDPREPPMIKHENW